MPQRTNPFQELVASIMAVFKLPEYKVDESVLVTNEKTGAVRKLDTSNTDPTDRILVECRDHQRRQDVEWIDQLEGKAKRLGFRKVVAVSSSGFYKTAAAEARDRGIEPLHLREAESRDWRNWRWGLSELGLNVRYTPVIVGTELHIRPPFLEQFPQDAKLSDLFVVDVNKKLQCSLQEWTREYVNDPQRLAELDRQDTPNATTHYTITIPCDPWIGVRVGETGPVLPLGQLVLRVDSTRLEAKVPMKHYEAGSAQVMVGDIPGPDSTVRLVLHEENGTLKTVLEERRTKPKPKKKRRKG